MRCYASANLIWSELEIGVDVPLAVELDRSSPVPLYYQLAQAIEAAIRDGELAPGDRFENELALASRLSLSRPTTRRDRLPPNARNTIHSDARTTETSV